jgi:hypothetical protein
MRHTLVTFALATGLPVALAAQTVPVRTLTTADAEYSEPFSQIVGMRELRSGRVIVADNRDKTIQLIDFKGEAKAIGREGSGPAEYGLPSSVFAAPGDTTWVYDILNSRYLVIDPTGKPVSTFMIEAPDAAPAAPPRGGRGGRGGGLGPGGFGRGIAQGIDAQGRLYFRAPIVSFGNDGPRTSDTTPIIRWDRKTGRTDTVGVLVNPAGAAAVTTPARGGDEVRVSVRIGPSAPFESADAYAVTAAGDVAVVRARDYHVDWIVKGKTVSGAPIRYERVKVTDEDKKNWIEARKNATGTMVVNENGNRRVQSVSAAAMDGGAPPEFPEFKGPFLPQVVAAPNGHVWVPRHVAANAPPTYDVIDNAGKVVQRVVLPKRTRLLGFGNGAVYLARIDADDLQYLQRYRW